MTNSGEGFSTAREPDMPATGLSEMAQDLIPGAKPTHTGAELLHVAVIDSHCLTRECIANGVSCIFDEKKIVSFSSVFECNSQQAHQFGLVILHLHGPESDPLKLIGSLRSAHGLSVVFLISDHDYQTGAEFIRAASRLGARGFVSTKTTGLALALSAIRFVQAGGFFAPVDGLLSPPPPRPRPAPMLVGASELTPRETVVLGLLKEGKTNKTIARDLQLSSNTVKVHVHNILRKMQVGSRTEAALIVSPAASAKEDAVLIA
jgi:DNA-binding NarL/FixJ family response regulator